MNKITLEFKPVKVKIPTENLTLEALEQMVFDIRQELGKTALVNALQQYDGMLRKNRLRGVLKNIRTKTKYLQTWVGDIRYSRTLYKEKATGKPRYLLDEALGIDKNQRVSLRMTEIMGLLSSAEPYRKVQKQIAKLLGISWSHEAIRQNVIREGKRMEEQEAKEHEKIKQLDYQLPQDLPETVYNETDATYISRQNKTKGKGSKKRHLEVKLGIGYTGKEPRYKGGMKESNSEYLLCPFHLFRNLRRALPGKKKTQQRLKILFEKNKIDKVLSRLKRMTRMLRSRKLKEKIAEYYAYVKNNRQGIEASMRVRMDKNIISAGAVEPNIDKLVAHRFKGKGKSWSKRGAQSLLKICQAIKNNQWKNWWYKERGKKIEIKPIFKGALTAADMKRRKIAPFIETELPCYRGPDQSKPWVGILHRLCRARQLSQK
jgi:hypothetical protein